MKLLFKNYRCYIILLGGIVLCWPKLGEGQKYDYNWLLGYYSYAIPDSNSNPLRFGNAKMDFNHSPVNIGFDSIAMNFDVTNTSYCDNDGNLLFYTNGIYVANSINAMIENSDSLNAGWLQYVWDPTIASHGYRNTQGVIALEDVLTPNLYHLIYSFTDSLPGSDETNVCTPKIYTALIDISANGGLGKVIYKNQAVIEGYFGYTLSAVKHGNGRDWWIPIQKNNSNCFYMLLLDTSGIHLVDSICLGIPMYNGDIFASCFSPDGSKYVYLSGNHGLNIYDFDRCSGNLSSPINLPLPSINDSGWLGIGVSISPNSRFLYVDVTEQLYQFDLWNPNIFSTIDTVGIYDGFYSPDFNSGFQTFFDLAQLAPDGKIYISCGNTVPVLHVINYPNEKGDSCNFAQHSVHLPSASNTLPNFPNYRLGVLSGSYCDTLLAISNVSAAPEQIIKIFPNPSSDYVIVDYGFTDWNKGEVYLEITNELGQMVYKQELPMYSGFQKIDVSKFASGVYTVSIIRGTGVVAVAKLVKD